jgi:hypothetical protein
MQNFIIPWPSQYSGDFKNAVEFLEGIGYPPILFILDFIFSHGAQDWAIRYGDLEAWINAKLDNHFVLLTEVIETGTHESVDVIREYKIYYDRMYSLICGDDVEYEEDLYETIAVLRHYYSSVVLPDLGMTEWSSVVDFKDLENGYACVVFNSALGDLINDFYTSTQIGVHGTHPVSNLGFGIQGVSGIHGNGENASLVNGGGVCFSGL